MSLSETLAQLREKHGKEIPREVQETMHRATQDIKAATEGNPLEPGDRMPEFSLPTASGETIRSSDLVRKEGLVLTFYRGVW